MDRCFWIAGSLDRWIAYARKVRSRNRSERYKNRKRTLFATKTTLSFFLPSSLAFNTHYTRIPALVPSTSPAPQKEILLIHNGEDEAKLKENNLS